MIVRRHLDWLRIRTLGKPLLEEQGRRRTVKAATAIPVKLKRLACSPAAAVLVDKDDRKRERPGQTNAVALTVLGLRGQCTVVIQRQAHHQGLHTALMTQHLKVPEIVGECRSAQGCQGCDGQTKPITASQSDALAAHIQAERRSWHGT